MNERNVCIGDVISFGKEVVLQVSLPRQPCFKLNHRFSLKNFAPTVYQSSRTGWYYRVLKEGTVSAGDEIKLVKRDWPEWTIERVQQYLHREKDNLEMNEKLAAIDAMGDESRGQFKRRVAKAKTKQEPVSNKEVWRDFKVTQREMETSRIMRLTLEAEQVDERLEKELLGAHARLKLPNGLIRTYSIVTGDVEGVGIGNKFVLGIALDDNSRGGSRYLHEKVNVGDKIQVGKITTDVNPGFSASNHIFIVGGIGITAFLALMEAMAGIHLSVQLHYAVRSEDEVAFRDQFESYKDGVVIYDKSKGERMDVDDLIKNRTWNSHVYVCGPTRLLEAAKAAAEAADLPENEIHYEAFSADTTGDAFEVQVSNRDCRVLKVKEEETLLEVLQREFDDIASSCEVGNCGTCKVTLCDGKADHRGTALLPEEKANSMLACVSRGIGKIVIEV